MIGANGGCGMKLLALDLATKTKKPRLRSAATRVWVNCAYCGERFWIYRSVLKKGHKRHYCCINHYHVDKSGSGNPHWKGFEEERKCQNPSCGKIFTYRAYDKRKGRGDGKFCSVKCKHLSSRKVYNKDDAKRVLDLLRRSKLPLPAFAKTMRTTERQLKKMLAEHFAEEYQTVIEHRKIKMIEEYRKGRAFETRTRKYLQSLGYVTMPSPGSQGPADLLAVKCGEILLIQCKLYGTLPKNGRIALEEMAKRAGGIPLLATTRKDQTIIFHIPTSNIGKKRKHFQLNIG